LLDIRAAVRDDNSTEKVAISNAKETIREISSQASLEFQEHKRIRMWGDGMWIDMRDSKLLPVKESGRKCVIGILNGLINRLKE
jgi:hypothetical protein